MRFWANSGCDLEIEAKITRIFEFFLFRFKANLRNCSPETEKTISKVKLKKNELSAISDACIVLVHQKLIFICGAGTL